MSRTIKKGATSQSIYVEILDSTSTTGGRKTGLAFNTSSLTGYYVRNGGSAVAITLATLAAANSAWSSGGFKEVDATNMPGVYRLDVPDAAFVAGAESVVITLKGATGMVQVSSEAQLVDNIESDTYARIGAPAGASVSADIATVAGYIDTEVGAIKAKTDSLTFTVAGKLDANVTHLIGTAITESAGGRVAAAFSGVYDVATQRFTAACFNNSGDPYARLGAPAGASVSADIAAVTSKLGTPVTTIAGDIAVVAGYVDTEVAAILAAVDTEVAAIKAKTDNLPAAPAAVSDIPTANANADALLDRANGIETGWTFRQVMRILGAALGGKVSGGGTATEVFRDITDTKARITATVDASGNRTAITLDNT